MSTGTLEMEMRCMQWNDLPDIESVQPLSESDSACLEEIRAVLIKHDLTDRFGVALLHKHFDLKEGECLVEYEDPEKRELTTVAKKESEVANAIQTLWRFAPDQVVAGCQRVCAKWCEPRTGTTGHWNRHQLESHRKTWW